MTMTSIERQYVVHDPEGVGWLVTVDLDGTVAYREPTSETYRWSDEDDIVSGIEDGSVNDEQWLYDHHEVTL